MFLYISANLPRCCNPCALNGSDRCFLWLFETASQIACYSILAALMEQLIELFEQKLHMACFFLSELSFALQAVSGKLGII